jgi:hypothetical protein
MVCAMVVVCDFITYNNYIRPRLGLRRFSMPVTLVVCVYFTVLRRYVIDFEVAFVLLVLVVPWKTVRIVYLHVLQSTLVFVVLDFSHIHHIASVRIKSRGLYSCFGKLSQIACDVRPITSIRSFRSSPPNYPRCAHEDARTSCASAVMRKAYQEISHPQVPAE